MKTTTEQDRLIDFRLGFGTAHALKTSTGDQRSQPPHYVMNGEGKGEEEVDFEKEILALRADLNVLKGDVRALVDVARPPLDRPTHILMEWKSDDPKVVEQFASVLGAKFFNHGGLLRVILRDGIHELHDGDALEFECLQAVPVAIVPHVAEIK